MAVDKRDIFLNNITERMPYKSSSHPVSKKYPSRSNYVGHARQLSREYEKTIQQSLTQKQVAAIKMKGTYAEFSGADGFELATKSLENRPSGIRLLNIRNDNGVIKATVYIPEGKEDFFRKRIEAYSSEKTKKGLPKNNDLVGSIESVKLALLDSFWTDQQGTIPEDCPVNCEVWLRYEIKRSDAEPWVSVENEFHNVCDQLQITVDKDKRILFPERIVKLISANKSGLKELLANCEYVTEIRRAEEPSSFFTSMYKREQNEWADELLSRCTFSDSNTSICLLDAGINDQHKLITPAILNNGLHAVDDSWGTKDSPAYRGHGTEMAGIAIYNDLQSSIESQNQIEIDHKIESVKILPNTGTNPRDLYGAITQQAVSMAEIDNPHTNRVICMAVTSEEQPIQDGRPSSWSASLDEITSSENEEDNQHRLFVVSAGNIPPSEYAGKQYPDYNTISYVEDPAQSWNAITVGGYAGKVELHDKDFRGFHALASKRELSPYSKTSMSWSKMWPVKPEVLFEAGNMATNDVDCDSCDDLSFLTTGHRPSINLFSTIWGTSAATAQAANFCAKILNEYPDMWPETVRALMIHSAEWTDEMHEQFCPKGDNTTKTQRGNLLRCCGYGIPDLQAAIQCTNSSVNMIVQDELQPYRKDGSVKMNEMHVHAFPWPSDLLRDLGETEVKIRITLSYYIEPSPGEVGWKDRYRYPSCGLRFEINRPNQSLEEFKSQVNRMARDEDNNSDAGVNSANNWYLGPNNRNVGSVHSDFIVGNAVDLCESRNVAVYPVGGWWKERPYLNRYEHKVKYSLVVTLSTPDLSVDLYTPIINQINTPIPVSVPISGT